MAGLINLITLYSLREPRPRGSLPASGKLKLADIKVKNKSVISLSDGTLYEIFSLDIINIDDVCHENFLFEILDIDELNESTYLTSTHEIDSYRD
jgi:hypothetical protein